MSKKIHVKIEKAAVRSELDKIVVNAGIGRAAQAPQFQEKIMPQIVRDLSMITGQKPAIRAAHKSIAGFKMREGQPVGLKITLRKAKMIDFLKRFITIVLPRVKDFRGISQSSVDKSGVLNVGLKEQFVFSEIIPEDSPFIFSLGINIVPKVKNREAAIEIYKSMGIPFGSKSEARNSKS